MRSANGFFKAWVEAGIDGGPMLGLEILATDPIKLPVRSIEVESALA